MKPKVFISYRRDDTLAAVGRIYDRLRSHFGAEAVFMDVDSIPPGVDFRDHLAGEVSRCDVVLAVIGNKWPGELPGGKRRIDDSGDFVHVEISSALSRDIPVVPVLVGSTRMPDESELPEGLNSLAYRNAFQVDLGKDFHHHMDELIAWLEKVADSGGEDGNPREALKGDSATGAGAPVPAGGESRDPAMPAKAKYDPYALGAAGVALAGLPLPPLEAIAVAMAHVSRGRLKEDSSLKGGKAALFAMVIGYAWIVGIVAMFAIAGFREMAVPGG